MTRGERTRSARLAWASAALAPALVALVSIACGDDAADRPVSDAGAEATVSDAGDAGDAAPPPVVPKGKRTLGVAMRIGDLSFAENVAMTRDAGAQTTNVAFAWDEIERPHDAGAGGDAGDAGDAGSGPTTQIAMPAFHIANLVLSSYGSQALLEIDALDVGGSRVPTEIASRPLDDPEVAARFDRVVDYALGQLLDTKLTALLVASSVDTPLGADAAKHAAFATFFTRAAAHARSARPGLLVGFDVSAAGLVAGKDLLAPALGAADVVAVSYLGVDATATALPASRVGAALDAVVAAVPGGKPVLIRQAGSPSSPVCGADEATQAAFVAAVFGAWDRHAARVPVVSFRELDDATEDEARAAAARAGRADAAHLAMLRSLGLRDEALRRKAAWTALVEGSRARGF